jgi:VWFA-related protein
MSRIQTRGVWLQTSVLAIALGTMLWAQNPAPQTPTFRSTADLTVVDAVVTDSDRNHVTDLTADDFELYQDGERQTLQQVVYVRAGTAQAQQPLASGRAAGAVPTASAPGAPASRFAAAADLRPDKVARTIALVVDDLGLSFESTFSVRNAVHTYIDTQIADGDLVAIVRTAGGMGALQQFTTDKRLLHKAADRIQWTVVNRRGVSAFAAVEPTTVVSGGATESPFREEQDNTIEGLRDSILATGSMGAIEFIIRGAQQLPGRKSLVVFSEGVNVFDRLGSARTWAAMSRMLDRANRAGVVIYTVDARGLQTGGLTADDDPSIRDWGPGMTPAEFNRRITENVRNAQGDRHQELLNTQEALQFIAAQTGGFAVLNTNDLNRGVQRVLDDQRGYYLLGYVSKTPQPGRWEQGRISVKVKRPGLNVRARGGVYGPSSPAQPETAPAEPLLLAALSPFGSGDVTVRLTALFNYDAKAGSYIRTMLFIDGAALTYAKTADGAYETHPEIVLVSVGDNGQIDGHWKQTFDLRFGEAEYARAREAGLVYHARIAAKNPGAYQVRAAVRDPATGHMGSASQFLEVPRVGKGRLALSGVLLRDKASMEPADTVQISHDNVLGAPTLRIYEPGSNVIYAYEVYDGLSEGARAALAMSTALLRDGKVLYESPASPIKAAATDRLRVIPIGGMLSLGKDVPPGTYSLEVRVSRRDNPEQVAQQWTEFEVRKP